MRKRRSVEGLTVNVVGGTHVVLLGLNLAPSRRAGCLGFAMQREDHTEDERYWMTGMKTFAATDPLLGPGRQVSSREHPFQSFQWAEEASLSVRTATEPEWATGGSPHSVFFNRGAIASQEYARRFQNQSPRVVGEAATAGCRAVSSKPFRPSSPVPPGRRSASTVPSTSSSGRRPWRR